ncbi:unnamed protein product [Kluyveromyces dobzhanskii CBS 2104]|uniref:nitric oxide dioxygenase n=1 Tax=Kluyveromyces dobzhanskii CBS 2104 TaxID=1427455 RepID=A0A0A8KYX2_9SACH|nr:unnamed protein product [Kluyveromyces dobzhanskii CBS 2104]
MLSVNTKNIIKTTIPVLEQHGVAITKTFYSNMLSENPDFLNTFNQVNQKKGRQPTALAMTVLAAAKNVDNLSVLLPTVKQIGHKHRALQIKPEQYDIVGHYLLLAIKEVLGTAATPEIINAWTETYKVIADIFISVENELYKEAAWPGWQPFVVSEKINVADQIVEFVVKPTSECGVDLSKLNIVPGQYLTVKTHPTTHDNKHDALRHYSICSASTENGLKFAVKYEHGVEQDGLVSEYLHKCIKTGDTIGISAPAGDFELSKELISQDKIPLVLISAGVGTTPLVAMLECQLQQNPKRPILWIQSSKNEQSQAFKTHVENLLSKFEGSVDSKFIHTDSMPRIDGDLLEKTIPSNSDVYICGSVEFMSILIVTLKNLGHQNQMVHYEPFGPKMSL